ncbi:hypothetical protein [Luedemannella flava]|uniref:hypothetical protein n=1 Tax=Luedemannella flava TaxID=349316 RepID=UPI0031D9A293
MPVRRAGIAVLFVAIAATAALVTNLVWYGDDDPRPAVAAVDVPADGYAYLTDHELAVVRDATVVGRALGRFSNADPHWTGDGKFAFAVSGDAEERVVVVDWAGTATAVVCDCLTAAPGTDGKIVWVSQGRLWTLTPGTTQAEAGRAVPPPPSTAAGDPTVVGSDGTRVFLAQETVASASITSDRLLAVDAGGAVKVVEPDTGSVELMRPGGVGPTGPLAYVVAHREDPCRHRRDVHLLGPDGTVEVTDTAAVGGTERDVGRSVDDLWWGRDGRLYATMSSWRCVEWSGNTMPIQPHGLWRLDGRRWVAVDGTESLAWRQLGAGRLAFVDLNGVLHTEHDGRRTKVAEGVRAIHAPVVGGAPDAAAAASGRPVPTYGQLVLSPNGVGPIVLGATSRAAERAGLVSVDAKGDCVSWTGKGALAGLVAYPDQQGRASYMSVFEGSLRTATGAGIGTKLADLRRDYGGKLREYVSPVSDNYRAYFVDEGPNSMVFLPIDGDRVKAVLIGPTDGMQGLVDSGEVYC